jgi:hypothetical protein
MVMEQIASRRDQVGDFVRYALPGELAEVGVPWAHSVDWDEREIRLTITRGDLAVTRALTYAGVPAGAWHEEDAAPWWQPPTREWAGELTKRLVQMAWFAYTLLREVDETGRLLVTVWTDPAREGHYRTNPCENGGSVRLRLEPGFMLERSDGDDAAMVRRVFEAGAVEVADALERGWARLA